MKHPGRDKMPQCPNGEAFEDCRLTCKYNLFESGDLRIDSWELKCLDCGKRQTIALRSDEPEEEPTDRPPEECPFCGLCAAGAGKNLCQPAG